MAGVGTVLIEVNCDSGDDTVGAFAATCLDRGVVACSVGWANNGEGCGRMR